MSLTRTSRRACSARMRLDQPRDLVRDADDRLERRCRCRRKRETSSAVSSMVSGRAYSDCSSRVVRPAFTSVSRTATARHSRPCPEGKHRAKSKQSSNTASAAPDQRLHRMRPGRPARQHPIPTRGPVGPLEHGQRTNAASNRSPVAERSKKGRSRNRHRGPASRTQHRLRNSVYLPAISGRAAALTGGSPLAKTAGHVLPTPDFRCHRKRLNAASDDFRPSAVEGLHGLGK